MNIHDVIDIAQEAGKTILEVYSRDFKKWDKEDQSPVTEADLLSDQLIHQRLQVLYPQIPVLSEEGSKVTKDIRQQWSSYFLVDPLDGTKEFLKKNGEFTVNICLMEMNKPKYGVVHIPLLNKTYYNDDEGSYVLDEEGTQTLPRFPLDKEHLRLLVSHSHAGKDINQKVKEIINILPKTQVVAMGSSLKMCKIAEGSADIYPRLFPTMEWDTAASQAILNKVEAVMIDITTGEPLLYNKDSLKNNSFLCLRKEMVVYLDKLLKLSSSV